MADNALSFVVVKQWVLDVQSGKPREVTVGGEQNLCAMLQTKRCDARIVNPRAIHPGGQQQIPQSDGVNLSIGLGI